MGKKIEGRLKKKAHIGQNSATFAAGNSKNVNGYLAVESKDKYDVCKREERNWVSVTMTMNPHRDDA